MNEKILSRIKETFSTIGVGYITGHAALNIINNAINEFTIPEDVQEAQKYIRDCESDIGFCGSPEYNRQKAIVDAYFEPIRKKQEEENEYAELVRLQQKYQS